MNRQKRSLPCTPLPPLFLLAVLALWLCFAALAQLPQTPNAPAVLFTDHGNNSPAQISKPYVVLVSLDGFRYDYARRFGATHILALAQRGSSAPQGMIPVFPSVTFPSHYSMVTGLYPEHHGIVFNSFYDPVRRREFVFSRDGNDGSWYGGIPLWVLAERQNMRTASFFWPGSDAAIDGLRPTYSLAYDSHVTNNARVDQAIAWLGLPPEKRPHFITLYFGEVDAAGHATGTNSPQLAAAVRSVDSAIARLVSGIAQTGLPVDLFVLSDHGMADVQGGWIDLEKFAALSGFITSGPLLYAPDEAAAARVYSQLRGASDKFTVYRRRDVPRHLHFNSNPRIGDPVVIPTGPYLIRARNPNNPREQPPPKGMHGYDPQSMIAMRAIFYAAGPDIRPGLQLPPFENIHVYPLIAAILGLPTGPIDADLRVLQPILRSAPPLSRQLPPLHRPGALYPSPPRR